MGIFRIHKFREAQKSIQQILYPFRHPQMFGEEVSASQLKKKPKSLRKVSVQTLLVSTITKEETKRFD